MPCMQLEQADVVKKKFNTKASKEKPPKRTMCAAHEHLRNCQLLQH